MSELNGLGNVKISDEVIAEISAVEAEDIKGIVGICDSKTGFFGIKSAMKGVRADIREGIVDIDVDIIVEYGTKIQDVCMELQNKIKKAVESMTGLVASKVNVNVKSIKLPDTTETTEEK